MHQVTIHEAKTHLSRLIQAALAGEEVVIAKGKQPLDRLLIAQARLEDMAILTADERIPQDGIPATWQARGCRALAHDHSQGSVF